MARIYLSNDHPKIFKIIFVANSIFPSKFRLYVIHIDYFMDVECKWPGSEHNAKVFANSSINRKMKTGQRPETFIKLLPGYEAILTI